MAAAQSTAKTKRARLEDTDEITFEDLARLCLKMSITMDKQNERTQVLEDEVTKLKSVVATLTAPPPSPSVPAPTPIPEESTGGDDDLMQDSSPSNVRPSNDLVPTIDSNPETPTDLERSIVIARLPVNKNRSPEEQVRDDYDQVIAISSLVGYPVLPIAVYRMPPRDVNATHPRLTKVVLPTRQHAKLLVQHASR
ncbi:hypothetical protein DXG03_005572, partial [Asterophora parasitica]